MIANLDRPKRPKDAIVKLMETRGLSPDDLAENLGLTDDQFSELLAGRRRLTSALAEALVENFGSTTRFWLARNDCCVPDQVQQDNDDKLSIDEWLQSIPTQSMRRLGLLRSHRRISEQLATDVLDFFGCSSLREWSQRYSKGIGAASSGASFASPTDEMATLVWLRLGERIASGQEVGRYDPKGLARAIPELKRLCVFKRPTGFVPRLRRACGDLGVHLTTARSPTGCRASGASWFGEDGNPVIHLSFRHLTDDCFWSTFFREAAHLVLHARSHIAGDGADVDHGDPREEEANAYARDILMPPSVREQFPIKRRPGRLAVVEIARAAGVTPGIVVGQLQQAGLVLDGRHSQLKSHYRWAESPFLPLLIEK